MENKTVFHEIFTIVLMIDNTILNAGMDLGLLARVLKGDVNPCLSL